MVPGVSAACPWASSTLPAAWSVVSHQSNHKPLPLRLGSRAPPSQFGSWSCRLGRGSEETFAVGGGSLEAGGLPVAWEGLGAGLTVSTLPAVRSIELALMVSRVMSARISSSATMPL